MKSQIIRIFAFVILASFFCASSNAQDYLTGKMGNSQVGEHEVYYDRTEYSVGISIYQTVYKVLDLQKKPLCTVTLLHDKQKALLYVTIKEKNIPLDGFMVKYDKNASGLIFSNRGNNDTTYKISEAWAYLVSFTDVEREFPVLHKIQIPDIGNIQLDPISKVCLKRHAEIIRALGIVQSIRNTPESKKDALLVSLQGLRDSLYAESAFYYDAIAEIRGTMEGDVKHYCNENKIYDDETRYEGEKKRGKPDGKGLQLNKGNVYDGIFSKAIFVSGNVVLRRGDSEYYGQSSNGAMNGTGWLKFKNGNISLGIFVNGKLSDGIALTRETTGDVYFGVYQKNQRTGYGEFRSKEGSCYFGEFRQGRLIRGFAKEIDQFGYSTYSRIENGTKKPIDPKDAGDFFETTLYAKK